MGAAGGGGVGVDLGDLLGDFLGNFFGGGVSFCEWGRPRTLPVQGLPTIPRLSPP